MPKTLRHDNRKRVGASTSVEGRLGRAKVAAHLRSASTVRRLNMYNSKIKRNTKGEIVRGGVLGNRDQDIKSGMARIAPDRNWFSNTRTMDQDRLAKLRTDLAKKVNDPYLFLLKNKKLPMSLLVDSEKTRRMNLLTAESFQDTFGKKSKRKRPNLGDGVWDLDTLREKAESAQETYAEQKDSNIRRVQDSRELVKHAMFEKGQSKRIWGELFKVLDSSDVIVQVLDARDPMGTRCRYIEEHLRKERKHKHLIFLLNKCDLIPTWATARWVQILSKEYPTLAFHASMMNPFGKGSFIQLLLQFSRLHKEKKSISVGFIGYPNVGKSSVINTLRKKRVCSAAPIPGETKCWQYVSLFGRVHLIDCPGVVHATGESEADTVLRSVVRVEDLLEPEDYISEVLERVERKHLVHTYGIQHWVDHFDFLEKFARKAGRLLKGGDPDIRTAAKMVLYDWQRGRIPWFVLPPGAAPMENEESNANEDEEGLEVDPINEEEQDEDDPEMQRYREAKESLMVRQDFSKLRPNKAVASRRDPSLGPAEESDSEEWESHAAEEGEEEEEDSDEEDVAWEDLFPGAGGASSSSNSRKRYAGEHSGPEDEQEEGDMGGDPEEEGDRSAPEEETTKEDAPPHKRRKVVVHTRRVAVKKDSKSKGQRKQEKKVKGRQRRSEGKS